MIKGRKYAEIEMLKAFKSKRMIIWKFMNTSSFARSFSQSIFEDLISFMHLMVNYEVMIASPGDIWTEYAFLYQIIKE